MSTPIQNLPYTKDADFHNYGVFGELTWYAAERDRLISGARLDRASARITGKPPAPA